MKSLFAEDSYNEIKIRINALTPQHSALWGTMDVAQMLAHCCEPLKVALGKLELKKPNFLMRLMFKILKSAFYNDKPWKQGLPTSKEYRIVDARNFEEEKKRLLALIEAFYAKRDQTQWPPHPLCGNFTTEQWGKMQYKHLDHHLRQFGV